MRGASSLPTDPPAHPYLDSHPHQAVPTHVSPTCAHPAHPRTPHSPPPSTIMPVLRGAAFMVASFMPRMSGTMSSTSPGLL